MTPSVLQLDGDLDEWLSPIPAVVLGQLFAYHLTIAKGLDPEQPRRSAQGHPDDIARLAARSARTIPRPSRTSPQTGWHHEPESCSARPG